VDNDDLRLALVTMMPAVRTKEKQESLMTSPPNVLESRCGSFPQIYSIEEEEEEEPTNGGRVPEAKRERGGRETEARKSGNEPARE
jgi:hypothetical protein